MEITLSWSHLTKCQYFHEEMYSVLSTSVALLKYFNFNFKIYYGEVYFNAFKHASYVLAELFGKT